MFIVSGLLAGLHFFWREFSLLSTEFDAHAAAYYIRAGGKADGMEI